MPLAITAARHHPGAQGDRPLDLLFLGRPTAQKGWPRFLALVEQTGLRAAAIVPIAPTLPAPAGVALEIAPDQGRVQELLSQAKLVLVPSDYESFGLAQVEAVMNGCLVPILGRWPLWDGFPLLHWEQCGGEEVARRCRRLCRNEPLRRRLAARQWDFLWDHSVLAAPFLPGL